MKVLLKQLKQSFKCQPVWTTWSLLLAPFFFGPVFIAAVMLSIINLNIDDGIDFWEDSINL